ncbi:Efflux pump membrane transporter BepE [Bremerella volcania]|uniref:Efflux pump membrane transporter BepE n=1 Tax=Bremerella volcania TaxID=2527984 RepID=A0A518C5Q0_9BACT|nr:efflux RND transporter permease subunit [Bremerella volcania]QDU74556.1 Efflux pump membrane transporter BepE [Bremerella volcania]
MPGASAKEVEKQVSTRLERLLYQIDGVEYVYSMSRPGMAIVTVRFYVGQDREDSLIKLYNKIAMHTDLVPPGVTGWVVKPIEIDDVPIVNVTLWSDKYDDHELRRISEQVEIALKSIKNTGRTEIVGGRRRKISVWLDAEAMAGHNVTPLEISNVLRGANVNMASGSFVRDNREQLVESGPYLENATEIGKLVVVAHQGRPVYLSDVARIEDDPEEAKTYTKIGFGPGHDTHDGEKPSRDREFPAVTVAVAKQKGVNAVTVARNLEAKIEELKRDVLPDDVHVLITRNYGETANDKVNELVSELGMAIVIVVGLIALTLGWREAIIVVLAVPLTFGLTLLVNLLAGYTINRVTLFALILSLGLVVDDPIVDVENIFRHFRKRLEQPRRAVFTAVNEVRPPIILATLAVIVSFLPLFFITGMMGPYMRPMALNVPVAMLASMVVAFTATPWLSYHILKSQYARREEPFVLEDSWLYRGYRRVITPFLDHRWTAWLLIVGICALLVLASLLAVTGTVPLKMLPFDNKNEFQIVVDMPEGTTLETTEAALPDLAADLRTVPEVTQVLTFAGTASPIDFNGMVRHYNLRQGPNMGDIRVNLLPKKDRRQQSHEILLRLRDRLKTIADRHNANIKLVEVPPGPPVFSTLVAEIYGRSDQSYGELIAGVKHVRRLMESERGVVDVDDTVEDDQTKFVFVIDKEKASLHGVSTQQIAATLRLALACSSPGEGSMLTAGAGVLHLKRELNPLRIELHLPRQVRSSRTDLERLSVKTAGGELIQIAELGRFQTVVEDKTIYHKNLQRVCYVFGEMAGRPPAEAVLSLQSRLKHDAVPAGLLVDWAGEGEWKITLDVFRDLGIAFGAAVFGIYMLLVWESSSYVMPLVLMPAIPLTVIGILPGFWLLNLFWDQPVGGYANPVFFTATAMIGMIALSGIATRNGILLIEFVHAELRRCGDLRESLIKSGAVRFRPIFLTAGAAMLGAWPITLDPVFSGLAWALIFGLLVSTAFTLVLVPVVYWLLYEKHPTHGLAREVEME